MKKYAGIFILFFCIVLCIYLPTLGAGIVTDQLGWIEQYKKMGWHGIFNAFNDKSLHFVYHIAGYSLWTLFGPNAFAWGIAFIVLHALAAMLSYAFFSQLFKSIKHATVIAFTGSLLFLTSPYQTEPLVWHACVHYLVCVCLLLTALICFLRYVHTNRKAYIALFYTCYIPAVFTLEISFTLPLVLLLFILFYPFDTPINRLRLLGIYVLPSLIIVVCYFVLNKLLRNSFAGHYGAATHFNMNIVLLIGNLSKYVAKLFLWAQFVPYDKRSVLYSFFEKAKYAYLLFGFIALLSSSYLIWRRRFPKSLNIALLLFACFALALAPILNLFMYYITNVEGDRFTYWASVFAYITIAFAAIAWLRRLGIVLCLFLLGLNLYTLQQNINAWHNVREISTGLIADFKYYDAPKIYLLNIPDNFDGAYMFRSYTPDIGFAEVLELKNGTPIEYKLNSVLEYNMHTPQDAVNVEVTNDTTLTVAFAQYGNWWWWHGVGAGDREEKDYTIKIDGAYAYTITFKHKTPGAVYLYQQGNKLYHVKGF